jgi:4-hydroxyphenylpyruvate dioxygenase
VRPTLSQVCSLAASFDKDVEDYAAGACRMIEIWLGKLETYLESHSIDDVKKLLELHGVETPVASFQGGLLDTQGDARREHWKLFARRLELCRELKIGTLVVACDTAAPLDHTAIERVNGSLREAAEQAARHDVRLALEFQARAAWGNNLQTAAALVDQCGHPNLGICLDAFHFFVGSSKSEDLAYLSQENLFHVQLCDLSGVTRELAADADRILPGDGDLPLASLLAHLRSIAYDGCISVELMNPQIWQVPPRQFGEVGITALRKLLGQASMG